MIKLVKTVSSDILSYESRLKQKEDITNDLERDASYFRSKIILVMMVCKTILYFNQCINTLKW